jgi:diaminohydroxyphosphoribosylaminopyrimidine deaminase/5-amino-6-(5-phosphoribosylamino)uracil reductase
MERCLMLALQAQGRTAPNPVVGAVVVDTKGEVVGEGFHARAGEPHAEVHALDAAGDRARGGTLYVSLEPCCHHGRTPPCSTRVTASGVARVVVGIEDPNPKVAGGGLRHLREKNLIVDVGILQEECAWANRAFIKRIRSGRPWVCLKIAATLDGRIADRSGSSRWISGLQARQHVMQLRNTYDCVIIGAHTARCDDPQLTVRELEGGRNPHRAVVDAGLTVPRTARLWQESKESGAKTFFFCSEQAMRQTVLPLPSGIELVPVETMASGRLDLTAVLEQLAQRGINSILCEGGGRLGAALLSKGLIDEVHWIVAPKILNDIQAISAAAGDDEVRLSDALNLSQVRVSQLGGDVLIEGTLKALHVNG